MKEDTKMSCLKSTIRKYERLKFYRVESIDGQIIKYTPVGLGSENDRLKIYLNERVDRVYFLIYSVDVKTKNREIHDELCLDEIDINAIMGEFREVLAKLDKATNEDGEIRKRIEFKRKGGKKFYAVEFQTSEGFKDLANTITYLIEAYPTDLKTESNDIDSKSDKESSSPHAVARLNGHTENNGI